ncbi:PHD-finger family protein [Candida parapsilosis]|nr:PHD-finger family protein [Candida parapsilosis]KAF6058323.1 PHD-finger family protein [Candida parapsilosis]
MGNQDEEQLLEDASTLLMFASAAAHQRSPTESAASPPPPPQQQQIASQQEVPSHIVTISTSSQSQNVKQQDPAPKRSSIRSLMNVDPEPEPEIKLESMPSRKTASPPSNLPKQGVFKRAHERSRSTPDGQKLMSPTYERGIDLRKGERDGNNAVLAAAALTAAADIPFPLKQVENSRIPPLETYQVDQDSGIIGCICGIEDDDGFTIQCDICFRWQHCVCMGYENGEEVPEDEYKCYFCDQQKWNKFDPNIAREKTLARLNAERLEQEKKEKAAIEEKMKEAKVENNKRKHSSSDKGEKKRKTEEKVEVKEEEPQEVNEDLPNKDNELLEEGVVAEPYQSVYYQLRENDYKREGVRKFLSNCGTEFYKEYVNLPKEKVEKLNVVVMSENEFKSLQKSRLIRPKLAKYFQDNNRFEKKKNYNNTKIEVKSYTDNQKQRFNGISKLSLFISTADESLVIPEGTPIIEYLGEIDFFTDYCNDKINQYPLWGTTKPKVLKSAVLSKDQQPVELVIDSRFVGDESRFIRKSCLSSANCKIRPVYIPNTNTFKFLVVTSKPIVLKGENSDEELRLPWEWDPDHPILRLYEDSTEKFENLTSDAKSALIAYVDTILQFVECGCSTNSNYNNCAIFKIKKATSYLMRSTRKAAIMNNTGAKTKEELVLPRPNRQFVSWKERMIERDRQLQEKLLRKVDQAMKVEANEPQPKVKPKVLFKVPFKQELLMRTCQQAQPMVQVTTETEEADDTTSSVDDLAIPIMPELVTSIELQVCQELHLNEGEVNDNAKKGDEVRPLSRKHSQVQIHSSKERRRSTTEETKPTKKLSLAEYIKAKT